MNSIPLTKLQNDLIKKIAKDEGFIDYTIEIKSGSMRGDGYMGTIHTVRIENKAKTKQLNLILKSALNSDELRKQTPIRKAYEREIQLYSEVFPQFNKLRSSTNSDNNFKQIAKCYGFLNDDKNECLVLENLKEINYKLWNRKLPMNSDHVSLIFQAYGKLHAFSHILKELQPKIYNEFEKKLDNIFEEIGDEKTKTTFGALFQGVFKLVEGNEKAISRLQNFGEQLMSFMAEEMKKINKYSVIIHGDCWCNNMLFKYEDPKNPSKPTKACLLDWQLARIGSPICDLSYFFYSCSSKEVLYDLKSYLKIYYDSFSGTMRQFNCDPNKVMTYKELEDQWKMYSKFGMFMAILIVKIMLTEVDEVLDLGAIADSGQDIMQAMCYDTANMAEYNERISNIINFMVDNDYL